MSKQADKQWGEMWSREKEMECHIALRALARCVFIRWRNRIKQECDTNGEWIAGNSHDIWNLMYTDMKALYTLEQLVNNHYKTRGIDGEV